MADLSGLTMAAATLELPDGPLERAGVRLALAPAALRLSLRGRDVALLERETGLALPTRIGNFAVGVARLGPDEWIAILPADAVVGTGAGQPVSIVDVSSRAIGITIDGPGAAALIGTGCPLDLARMAPGCATRTLFETVEIVLIRHSELSFYIEVWRSFGPWLFGSLSAGLDA